MVKVSNTGAMTVIVVRTVPNRGKRSPHMGKILATRSRPVSNV